VVAATGFPSLRDALPEHYLVVVTAARETPGFHHRFLLKLIRFDLIN
jgi:hypothetical protein